VSLTIKTAEIVCFKTFSSDLIHHWCWNDGAASVHSF